VNGNPADITLTIGKYQMQCLMHYNHGSLLIAATHLSDSDAHTHTCSDPLWRSQHNNSTDPVQVWAETKKNVA